jgi:hypothetical protein
MPVTDDVSFRIKAAVAQVIVNLNLTGGQLPGSAGTIADIGSNVYSQLLPDESNVKFPCVLVTTEGEREEPVFGSTTAKQRWIPFRVFIADRNSPRRHESEGYYLWWRNQIFNAFFQKKLTGVDEVCGCEINLDVIFDPKLPQYQFIVSGMVLRFFVSEVRG